MDKDIQIVGFQIGRETYGLPIATVREIIRLLEITAVPRVHQDIEGVINLRGRIVPVIDLPKKFGAERRARTGKNRIVVVEAGGRLVGLLVDSATEVMRIPPSKIEKPTDVFAEMQLAYVSGVGKLNGRVVILLDLTAILSETKARGEKGINKQSEIGSAVTVV
jgi:purine-binding chemotaxis protein CheW